MTNGAASSNKSPPAASAQALRCSSANQDAVVVLCRRGALPALATMVRRGSLEIDVARLGRSSGLSEEDITLLKRMQQHHYHEKAMDEIIRRAREWQDRKAMLELSPSGLRTLSAALEDVSSGTDSDEDECDNAAAMRRSH